MANNQTTGPENPFTQVMAQAKAAAEEFGRRFANVKLSGMPDAEALLAAQRRNFEAFSAANRIALEGAQAVAKRNMEIIQHTMAEMTETMRGLTTADAGLAAERLKAIYERAVADIREVGELIQKANGEALGPLNKRVAEAMAEMKTLVDKAKPGG